MEYTSLHIEYMFGCILSIYFIDDSEKKEPGTCDSSPTCRGGSFLADLLIKVVRISDQFPIVLLTIAFQVFKFWGHIIPPWCNLTVQYCKMHLVIIIA